MRLHSCDRYREVQRRKTGKSRRTETKPAAEQANVLLDQVRAHVAELIEAGFPATRIARAAKVHQRSVPAPFADGSTDKLHRRISPKVAARILAVTPDSIATELTRTRVDAIGTRRRLQALAVIGWTWVDLSGQIGVKPCTLERAVTEPTVTVATARNVARLFARLWQTPGPSVRACRAAVVKGWVGPDCWNNATIDDPLAVPDSLRGRRRDAKRTEERRQRYRLAG